MSVLVRETYTDFKQYESVKELGRDILKAWSHLDLEYCKKIKISMPDMLIEFIEKRRDTIDY